MGARALRRVWVSAVLLAALCEPGCGKVGNTGLDEDQIADDVDTLLVEPRRLDFTHIVRQDPCPQLAGRFTVRNVGFTDKTVELELGPHLRTAATEVRIEGGRSVEIEVYFDCSIQANFVSAVKVYFLDDLVREVVIYGTVVSDVL